VVTLGLAACTGAGDDGAGPPPAPAAATFLALGDSYTIGEAVAPGDRWPVQLAARLRAAGDAVADPTIIARTGWTTDELAAAIDAAAPRGPFRLVTLMVGVNDQYRGRPLADTRTVFHALVLRAVALAGGDARRVVVLSVPDWGVTPFAGGRDRARIAREIDALNAMERDDARAAGAAWVDVTPASREAASDPALVARDGLHPSAALHARWADLALAPARAALGVR
jgi:lysophospholipase L1-like esterase